MTDNQPLVSVVINTYNRLNVLKTALEALRYQDFGQFEVIVVNGPSTDGTAEYVKSFSDIKYGECPELNLSLSRNIGIAMASGRYIAFLDDDAIPEPEWLSRLLEAFGTNASVAAVGGFTKDPSGMSFQCKRIVCDRLDNVKIDDFNELIQYPYCFRFPSVMGCNCMFNREKLLSIGAFDEQYDYYLDETDVCARLVDAGYTVEDAPKAFVIHKYSPSPLRDNRKIPLDWTKIIKNTVYFINQQRSVLGDSTCDDGIQSTVASRTSEMAWYRDSKCITESEYAQAVATIQDGLNQGQRDSARGRRLLISEATLAHNRRQPIPFKCKMPDGRRLVVALLVDQYPPKILGGIGRFVHQTAVGLAKLGHQVHVITTTDLSYDTVDFEDGVWVHRITMKQYPDHLLKRDTCACDFHMPRMNQLYSYYEELQKIEERVHVDIVESPIWDCLGFYAMLDSRFNTIVTLQSCMKSVFTDPLTMPPEVRQYMQLEHETLVRCRNIMPISNAIMKQLESYYDVDLGSRSTVVNLGLADLAEGFVPESRTDARVEILFLGRLEHRKGIDILLETVPSICEKHPNAFFRFAGDNRILVPGKSYTYEQQFFAAPGNEKYREKVCFEGAVSEERLRQLYAQCDIYVSPSRYESFGLIFLEAMMFAKPVVGCNVGGMPEVIGPNGEAGFLAQPGDVASLRDCLDRLVGDEDLRKRMGAAGRARYEKHFTVDMMVQNTLAYYRQILERE